MHVYMDLRIIYSNIPVRFKLKLFSKTERSTVDRGL